MGWWITVVEKSPINATSVSTQLTRQMILQGTLKKQQRKTKPMQPMLIYIYLCKYSEETYERPINATIVNTHNLKQAICRGIWKNAVGKGLTYVTSVTINPTSIWVDIEKHTLDKTRCHMNRKKGAKIKLLKQSMNMYFLCFWGFIMAVRKQKHAKNYQKNTFGALFRTSPKNALWCTAVQCNVL